MSNDNKDKPGHPKKSKVVDLKEAKKSKKDNSEAQDVEQETAVFLQEGLEHFNASLNKDTESFITITFNKDHAPLVVVAGELDLIQTIGILDVCKNDFINALNYTDVEDQLDA